jgi:HEAT repeat protein
MPVAVVAGNESYVILVQLSRWRFPVCYMTNFPPLTISLLAQISDRDLQSNYLNHVDRTDEVTSLFAQIEDKNLALRIINLALEVDIVLGSRLTSSAPLSVQAIIVEQINNWEINVSRKIELWRKTKSKTTLAYLQDIFVFKNRYRRMSMYFVDHERDTVLCHAMDAIIELDRNLAAALMIESLYDNRFRDRAANRLVDLATVEADTPMLTGLMTPEAIEALGDILSYRLCDDTRRHVIDTLCKIGTEAAITKIREGLYKDKSRWLDLSWIQGLGVVGDTSMVEHLLYLLYFGDEYIDSAADKHINKEYREEHYRRKVNELICEAVLGIERLNGDLAFEILHQSLYWVIDVDYPEPSKAITQALFHLDRERTFVALECAICSCDLVVRMRVVKALGDDALIDDRNLSILLDALEDQEPEVRMKIVNVIRFMIYRVRNPENIRVQICGDINISPELLALAANNSAVMADDIRDNFVEKDIDNRVVQRELIKKRELGFIDFLNISQLDRLLSDVELTGISKYPDHLATTVRTKILARMRDIGDTSVLPRFISCLEDEDYSTKKAAIEGIVSLGIIEIMPTLLSIAAHSELVEILIWCLEELKEMDKTAHVFDLFLKDYEWTVNFLETAEKHWLILTRINLKVMLCHFSAWGQLVYLMKLF